MVGQKVCRLICAKAVRLLTEERQKRKLSKYAVAERSGLSQQMISYVERGLRNPSFETIMRMADAMEVDLEKIIVRARQEAVSARK